MIDIELIRRNPEVLMEACRQRGQSFPVEKILDLDKKRRSAISSADELRAKRNEASKMLGKLKDKPASLICEMREVGQRIKHYDDLEETHASELTEILQQIPNIPSESAPLGDGENSNVVRRSVGDITELEFQPKTHWELGESLGIIDLARGAKITQARFYVLKGKGAQLQRALVAWMLDFHTQKHGYEEIYLPYLVNRDTVIASGHLPHFEENMYHDQEDDLFMVPTAEAPITSLFRGEILDGEKLPLYYVAHTPCWRREKFSAGRDTRGIKRVHQFDKVEMYKFVEPKDSYRELEDLVSQAGEVCEQLGIPHRVLEICTGDLGFAASKSYDVEMWSAGTREWLEVSSCSNCTDFQARRSAIRYRMQGDGPKLIHTLNGSGLAIPRVLISILEYYQESDGSVEVPEVLRRYLNFDRICPA